MTNPNHCPPGFVLAGIIRQVDGKHDLSPDALAEAILKHPGSCWGPAVTPTNEHKLPVPTNTELEANFRAWFKAKYDTEYFGGLALCDAIAWVKQLLQQGAQPAAPWPELPEDPPLPEACIGEKVAMTLNDLLQVGHLCGWQAARAELQRQREQAGAVTETVNWRDLCAELLKGLDENRHEEVWYPGHLRTIMGQARAALQHQLDEAQPPAPCRLA